MKKPLVMITGASSGIGASIARLFSQNEYPLALLARNQKKMQAMGLPNALCITTDVSDTQSFHAAIQQAENEFGPVDCLINNAGFSKGGDFSELSHTDHEQMIKVNFLGVINGMEAIIPAMRLRKTGTIINISSVADRKARPTLSTYAATKAGVKSLTESLRVANAKYGIRICNVAPAKILTPLLIQSNLDDDQIIPADDVAKTILWIYQQPQSTCIRDIVIAPTAYEH